jgi:hypothetical protein
MYRSFAQLREGWTKNLALLFPSPGRLAMKVLGLWALFWAVTILVNRGTVTRWWNGIDAGIFVWLVLRLQAGNFANDRKFLGAIFGMPMFAYLLLRSKRMHQKGTIVWKSRTYEPKSDSTNQISKEYPEPGKPLMKMKTPLTLIPLTIVLAGVGITTLHAQPANDGPHFNNNMIEPGLSVGPLKLAESRDRAFELFPKKDIDQEWEDPCGTTIDWTDNTNPVGHGDVLIRLKKGKIYQIESATTRFHTAEDITTFDPPEKVAHAYKDMRAYVLLTTPNPALGSRPPVFWVDKKKGIAFELAFDPSHHKRYIYKIIVFEPNKNFCPEQETINSTKWQSIDPYSVEPPRDLSPEP